MVCTRVKSGGAKFLASTVGTFTSGFRGLGPEALGSRHIILKLMSCLLGLKFGMRTKPKTSLAPKRESNHRPFVLEPSAMLLLKIGWNPWAKQTLKPFWASSSKTQYLHWLSCFRNRIQAAHRNMEFYLK